MTTAQQPPHEHQRPTAQDDTDDGSWHPAWCDLQHGYVTDDGVRVHQTALSCYEDGLTRFELQMLCPEDEFVTYLELFVKGLCLGRSVYAFAPPATVAWLRDQLTEYLVATVGSIGDYPVSGACCCRADLDGADTAAARGRASASDSPA